MARPTTGGFRVAVLPAIQHLFVYDHAAVPFDAGGSDPVGTARLGIT